MVAYRELPPNPTILERINNMEREVTANGNVIRSTNASLLKEITESRKDRSRFFREFAEHLKKTRNETLETLETHRENMNKIDANIRGTRREMKKVLGRQGEELEGIERLSSRTATAVNKQSKNLAKVTERLEKLEIRLMPKPLLTSGDKLEKIKGIGPQLGKELRDMGIANVGELVLGDTRTIAEKTRISREMAEHLQTASQLLMIPSISETDAELLEEAGITTIRELANQDPIQLGRKIGKIVKVYIKEGKISENEKPTLEKISFWVKQAKV
jgi:predicted flap endonuclease-1-like 5' DNA nuclease